MNKSQKIFCGVFFASFIVAGIIVAVLGLVRLVKYYSAKEVQATVISVDYNLGADVELGFERGGEYIIKSAHFDKLVYENGELPFYEGKELIIRVNGSNEVIVTDNGVEIILLGLGFSLAGFAFMYFTLLKKHSFFDMALEYESAMVNPEDAEDDTGRYEAVADELTRLPEKSFKRMTGEAGVWGNRIKDRYKTYTVWENILYGSLLIIPIIILSVYPLFLGKTVSFGNVVFATIGWLFVYCFVGLFLKCLYSIYLQILVKAGRFSEKKLATVQCCAFESELHMSAGAHSRTYTVFKKFKVVALIDGKRSVGYVKGNVPPPQGAVLKVLVRPHRLNKWIIDNNAQ